LLEVAHPAQAGGFREVDPLGQRGIGHPPVALELVENQPIDPIQINFL
jgi:hypothetical protein